MRALVHAVEPRSAWPRPCRARLELAPRRGARSPRASRPPGGRSLSFSLTHTYSPLTTQVDATVQRLNSRRQAAEAPDHAAEHLSQAAAPSRAPHPAPRAPPTHPSTRSTPLAAPPRRRARLTRALPSAWQMVHVLDVHLHAFQWLDGQADSLDMQLRQVRRITYLGRVHACAPPSMRCDAATGERARRRRGAAADDARLNGTAACASRARRVRRQCRACLAVPSDAVDSGEDGHAQRAQGGTRAAPTCGSTAWPGGRTA